jgi:hypothetical protein
VSAIPERNKGLAERMYVVEGDFTGGTPPRAVSLALLATSGSGPSRHLPWCSDTSGSWVLSGSGRRGKSLSADGRRDARRHFRFGPLTGHVADMAKPTRLTRMYGPAVRGTANDGRLFTNAANREKRLTFRDASHV